MVIIENRYRLSELAEEDLVEIFTNTIESWGATKAKEYSDQIEATFVRLAKLPDMGKSREELFPDALCFHVGSHVIFYRKAGACIDIARVLQVAPSGS